MRATGLKPQSGMKSPYFRCIVMAGSCFPYCPIPVAGPFPTHVGIEIASPRFCRRYTLPLEVTS